MGVNQRAEIRMTGEEIDEFIRSRRAVTLATNGPTGHPHLVAMWFALVDGALCFETKAKSQKAVNLRRDPRVSILMEDGDTYEELRGIAIEGTAEISEDADLLWQIAVSLFERYIGPYTEEMRPLAEALVHKRVAVRVTAERTRSWDHRKLGYPSTRPPGGTTGPSARRPE